MLIYLGVDEMSSIHENLPERLNQLFPILESLAVDLANRFSYDGSIWVIYYMPLIILTIPVFIFELIYIFKKIKWKILYILIGIFMLLSVPIVEIINTSSGFTLEIYTLWVALEEALEMLGITIFIGVCFMVYNKEKSLIASKNSLNNTI